MIDHPFAWPLRNNLRCKWNVYCYFRKSPWNDLYTVFNRILLKANVTIASSNLFAKKKMQFVLVSILSHNCLQSSTHSCSFLSHNCLQSTSLSTTFVAKMNGISLLKVEKFTFLGEEVML